jgi:hypothetical protein
MYRENDVSNQVAFVLTDENHAGIGEGKIAFPQGFHMGTATNAPKILSGTGSPEGVVTAGVGSLYTRSDGGTNTTLYVKQSGTGNTGWAAK